MSKKVKLDQSPALKFIEVKPEQKPEQKPKLSRLDRFRVYTLAELEPIIGVTHRTLLTYVKQGRLKAVKIGGKWKVTEPNLEKFLNGE